MKKTANLFAKTFFSLVVVGLASCGDKRADKPEKEHEEYHETVKPPTNIISLEMADSIYTNYSNHRVALIEDYETQKRAPEETFEAARFVDFDYDAIKQYIKYVDQEAKNAGVQKVTKLRLYFANYPDKKDFEDGKKVVHPRQNSIFMIPTIEKNGGNYSFFIGADGKPELVIDWKAQMTKGMGLLENDRKKAYAGFGLEIFSAPSLQIGGTSLTLNHGGSGPPPKSDF